MALGLIEGPPACANGCAKGEAPLRGTHTHTRARAQHTHTHTHTRTHHTHTHIHPKNIVSLTLRTGAVRCWVLRMVFGCEACVCVYVCVWCVRVCVCVCVLRARACVPLRGASPFAHPLTCTGAPSINPKANRATHRLTATVRRWVARLALGLIEGPAAEADG